MQVKTIGDRLRALRIQRGWKQKDIAGFLCISVPAYSKMEVGITDISITRLKELAKIFSIKPAALIEEPDEVLVKQNEALKESLKDSEAEVMRLQAKVLALYEQMGQVFG
ncbi:anaerobic benzoate catabolism transcriptional regulator [compost metagenome]